MTMSNTRTRRPCTTLPRHLFTYGSVLGAVVCLLPWSADAQILEGHAIYATSDSSHRTVHGGGVSFGRVGSAGSLVLIEGVGIDYVREPALGPGQGSLSASLALAPNRDASFLPYAGGAVSANRSGGELSQWPGTRAGFDVFVGVYAGTVTSPVRLSVEERLGTIQGQERLLSTRLGLAVAW